ncbi:hypothetical protein K443DRAFT_682623 [Laccaria amethystina LaAM-08-1]|uniref:Uncharacterized protein n=1 Tax=Laccaria amethystina LaAM-08-1 TaxID=1095629 RepID=A0A0C9WUM9_9AGAR|nr:hypothetical protein K443DRAFT_682623 [Laccaria amethystina LaAM-08-1]
MHDPMTPLYSFTTPPAFGLGLRLQEDDIPDHALTHSRIAVFLFTRHNSYTHSLFVALSCSWLFCLRFLRFISEGGKMINVYY